MNQASNKFKTAILHGHVAAGTDTFKMCLMGSGFVFDKAEHGVYADISSDEISAVGTTYLAGGKDCTGVVVAQDDTLGCGKLTITHPGWTAGTGETIGPCAGAIIYDDTVADTGFVKVIVAYIDFLGNKTVTEGGLFKVTDPVVKIS